MSLDATRWAWQQSDLRPTAKLMLLAFADRADENHRCFPSIQRLEQDTGLDRKTIFACISYLESTGLVTVQRRQGAGSAYQLNGVIAREHQPRARRSNRAQTGPEIGTSSSTDSGVQEPVGTPPGARSSALDETKGSEGQDSDALAPDSVEHEHPSSPKTGTGTSPVIGTSPESGTGPDFPSSGAENGTGTRTKNGTPTGTKNGTQNLPRESTSRTNHEPAARRAARRGACEALSLPDWLPAAAWNNWRAHRRLIKSPMTERAEQLQINRLDRLRTQGHDPVALIDLAIERGWENLHPPFPEEQARDAKSSAPKIPAWQALGFESFEAWQLDLTNRPPEYPQIRDARAAAVQLRAAS